MNKGQKIVQMKWIHTSDIHGDMFVSRTKYNKMRGALSAIQSYVSIQKKKYSDRLILTDGGDCLQGTPLVYYYNFINTNTPHIVAEVMNEVGYDCGVMGNHDIEVGEKTFERWMHDCKFPILGANVIDKRTGNPYLTPYVVLNRYGIKIVILGMVTTCVPFYQSDTLWPNLQFNDVLQSSQKWVPFIQEQEHPDILVGLFHSGFTGCLEVDGVCHECAVKEVAEQVPGFNFICYGHDHTTAIHNITNVNGNDVVCAGTCSKDGNIVEIDLTIMIRDGVVSSKQIEAKQLRIDDSVDISKKYTSSLRKYEKWISSHLCKLSKTMNERDAFFGPSLFVDYIHKAQMDMSGAEISFAAPYSYDSCINRGLLRIRDIFPLLAYEDFIHVLHLTGYEIKGFLEKSYDSWVKTIQNPDELLLNIYNPNEGITITRKFRRFIKRLILDKNVFHWRFNTSNKNLYSASGIRYVVDVTQPMGKRVTIISMTNGEPFLSAKMYRVAINHRIFCDMGEILSKGAGLSQKDELERNMYISNQALPYYIMRQMEEQKVINPQIISNWHFAPEKIVTKAIARDRSLLFSSNIIQEIRNMFKTA